jgi:hypothetical protein
MPNPVETIAPATRIVVIGSDREGVPYPVSGTLGSLEDDNVLLLGVDKVPVLLLLPIFPPEEIPSQVGTEIVSTSVETVPPKARALPVQVIAFPIVTPDVSMSVPAKVELAPSVVAPVGVQNISQAEAPLNNLTEEFTTEVSAPFSLNIYVPLPLRVIPAVPMDAALEGVVQYTPGV